MPYRPKTICRYPGCGRVTTRGYCPFHARDAKQENQDDRPSSARRGYDAKWRKIREKTLKKAGIPRENWPFYDIHHDPPYDPEREPDHLQYKLTPVLHQKHSRHTAKAGGGFGNAAREG